MARPFSGPSLLLLCTLALCLPVACSAPSTSDGGTGGGSSGGGGGSGGGSGGGGGGGGGGSAALTLEAVCQQYPTLYCRYLACGDWVESEAACLDRLGPRLTATCLDWAQSVDAGRASCC